MKNFITFTNYVLPIILSILGILYLFGDGAESFIKGTLCLIFARTVMNGLKLEEIENKLDNKKDEE